MDLLEHFKTDLRATGKSEITIKNYLSDIRRFIIWFEKQSNNVFIAQNVRSENIQEYRLFLSSTLNLVSAKRHTSSLNQFFLFLVKTNQLPANTVTTRPEISQPEGIDGFLRLREFRSYLYEQKCSELTLKNYVADIRQFTQWTKIVLGIKDDPDAQRIFFSKLTSNLINTYKQRLLTEKQLSPVSINRKLSSLRGYLKFASKYGLIDQKISVTENESLSQETPLSEANYKSLVDQNIISPSLSSEKVEKPYSPVPPLRFFQKTTNIARFGLNILLITPLAEGVLVCQKLLWTASGGRMFYQAVNKPLRRTRLDSLVVDSFEKSFYAPLSLSFATLPLYRRLFLTLRHKRPFWYKKYHTYTFVHYVHFGILGIGIIVMGSLLYERLAPSLSPHILGTQIASSGRQLQFRGLLLDNNSKPITSTTPLRFTIYDDRVASGSSLLWQDVQEVTPDNQGNFSVLLGSSSPIPNDTFLSGKGLYLGIAVSNSSELAPRQSIPNVQLAQDSNRVGGFLPITADDAGSQNVLLALDSAGNLTIGKSSPVFQATDGSFTLRAQSLVLSSLSGSNGNIVLSPDGYGMVDISKPIQNTSEFGSQTDTRGSVEVADAFAIIATTSGQSAFTINQNGGGPLISASSSGIAKFNVDGTGAGYFAGNITFDGTDLATNNFAISLFNRNAQIINLGGESIAVTIGSQSGTTTIRTPSTNLNGNLTITGKTGTIYTGDNAGISFAGNGNHSLKAESGSLLLDSHLQVGRDLNILPQSNDGVNNLGSSTNPFDTLYVNNIVSSAINGQATFWGNQDGLLRPVNITNDIIIGGSATESAAWQVFGSGSNRGTASSSGNLTFTGITTNINQLNGGSLTFQTSPGGDNQLNPQLTISSNGIGMGTSNPQFRLDLQDTRSATATAMLSNLDTGANSGVLALKIGNTIPTLSNYFTTFLNGKGEIVGKISGNGLNGVTYSTSGSDFAEYFLKHDPEEMFAPGNIVCLDNNGGVTKCTPSQTSIIGVVSDRPAFVGNATREHDSSYVLVGLQGQVPVLASDENGPIQATDSLTFSTTPGVAAKAIGPSPIVGQALEAKPDGSSRVNTYIKATWFDPTPHQLSQTGDLQFSLQKSDEKKDESFYVVIDTTTNNLLKLVGSFSDAVIGNLAVGMIKANEFAAKEAAITGKLLANLIIVQNLIAEKKIVSPLGELEHLRVNVISPLSGKDGLSLVFTGETITAIDPVSSKTAFLVDRAGNASFSGTLSSQELSVSEDATIGGTLRVRNLIADNIKGLESSSSATYVTNVTNIYNASSSAQTPAPTQSGLTPTPTTTLASSDIITPTSSSLLSSQLTTEFQPISSFSGMLANTKMLALDFATITSGLMVFGPASFSDIASSGQISVGGNLILASGAINVLGRDLELQSLRQGNLSIMGGLLTIDTEGNLHAKGSADFAKDVTIKGNLYTNLIAPIPDSDLVMKLNSRNHAQETSNMPESAFIIADSSGSAKFRVNNIGDLVASGSARFLRLMTNDLNLVRSAQADTSITQTVASSSAGTATINKGQRERTIVSPYVTEHSLIYLTPTSETFEVTPYVARQTAEDLQFTTRGSFTIQITRPVTGDINLNWWIIN